MEICQVLKSFKGHLNRNKRVGINTSCRADPETKGWSRGHEMRIRRARKTIWKYFSESTVVSYRSHRHSGFSPEISADIKVGLI